MHKVSIVTISFNQAVFLERTIRSVLEQQYPNLEYIVVDAGSTDGSREIINRYGDRITHVVFEPDAGPADGLNKAFRLATGDVLGYLNSDDILLPGAVQAAVEQLRTRKVDVVSGHAQVIDANDRCLRLVYSDWFSLKMYAYGACVLVQPSTFFTRAALAKTQGFNANNKSNWDGELFVDMAMNGATFAVVDAVMSGYRLHGQSITSTCRLHSALELYRERMFLKIMSRQVTAVDSALEKGLKLVRHLLNPRDTYERLARGPIYGRAS